MWLKLVTQNCIFIILQLSGKTRVRFLLLKSHFENLTVKQNNFRKISLLKRTPPVVYFPKVP